MKRKSIRLLLPAAFCLLAFFAALPLRAKALNRAKTFSFVEELQNGTVIGKQSFSVYNLTGDVQNWALRQYYVNDEGVIYEASRVKLTLYANDDFTGSSAEMNFSSLEEAFEEVKEILSAEDGYGSAVYRTVFRPGGYRYSQSNKLTVVVLANGEAISQNEYVLEEGENRTVWAPSGRSLIGTTCSTLDIWNRMHTEDSTDNRLTFSFDREIKEYSVVYVVAPESGDPTAASIQGTIDVEVETASSVPITIVVDSPETNIAGETTAPESEEEPDFPHGKGRVLLWMAAGVLLAGGGAFAALHFSGKLHRSHRPKKKRRMKR